MKYIPGCAGIKTKSKPFAGETGFKYFLPDDCRH